MGADGKILLLADGSALFTKVPKLTHGCNEWMWTGFLETYLNAALYLERSVPQNSEGKLLSEWVVDERHDGL